MPNVKNIVVSASASASRVGGRAENQDNYGSIDTPMGRLFVVCDGMGGGPGGRTASSSAVSVFLHTMQTADPNATVQNVMTQAVNAANAVLMQLMSEHAELQGMGTTLVAVLFNPQSAVIAHVGDSRLYQLRRGKVVFRTADHSLVGEMVRRNTITEEQARTSSQSNIITRALGAGAAHDPELDTIPYKRGDRFILCTDGIWGSMPERDLVACFSVKQPLNELVHYIAADVDKIGIDHGGHHDNLTLTAIDIANDSILQETGDSPLERVKQFVKHIIN